MKLIDVTAQIMGDPAATQRRAPTGKELMPGKGPGREERNVISRSSNYAIEVGEIRVFETQKEAKALRNWFYSHGFLSSIRKLAGGRYSVQRVG